MLEHTSHRPGGLVHQSPPRYIAACPGALQRSLLLFLPSLLISCSNLDPQVADATVSAAAGQGSGGAGRQRGGDYSRIFFTLHGRRRPRAEITSHMIPIYDKHKKLHATEVKKVLKSFGYILEEMFCKRLASILVEDNATTTSNNDHMPEDVTFHAPAGNAADVDHTRAPIHTSPEAHKSHAPQEVDVDREVAGCTNTNQNEAQQDIGLEKMQSCCFQGMEDAQEGPVIGEREKLVGAEVVEGYLKDPDDVDEGESVILSHNTVFAFQGPALEFDDGPSMSLFKEGTDDFECLNMDDDTARKYKEANKGMETPTHVSAGPTYDNTPKHAM
ncbi:hypothetical protein ZWY2020_046817 [Hordeum vulgare]|nr:hypothetical protein ZWY2020_046817 [Hordeum vulgare]